VLNPGGILFVSTNYSLLTHAHLEDMISAAAGDRKIRKTDHFGQDEDFAGSGMMQESYLAAVLTGVE
jgi:23S rRNA G2069 N7-methylase RlmK/C1962 C5-methylase RlmI